MPQLCEYMMCHRISSWQHAPFCSEHHKLAAEKQELRERLAQVEEKQKELEKRSRRTVTKSGGES